MIKIIHIVFLSFIALLPSCKEGKVAKSKEDVLAYVNEPENGCAFKDSVDDFKVSLIYKPSELFIYDELAHNKEMKKEEIENIKANYNSNLYFTMGLKWKDMDFLNSAGKSAFNRVSYNLSNNLSNLVYITTNSNDTFYLKDSYFPRLYEASIETTVLLVFQKDILDNNDVLYFNVSNELLPQKVVFKINKVELNNVPKLM